MDVFKTIENYIYVKCPVHELRSEFQQICSKRTQGIQQNQESTFPGRPAQCHKPSLQEQLSWEPFVAWAGRGAEGPRQCGLGKGLAASKTEKGPTLCSSFCGEMYCVLVVQSCPTLRPPWTVAHQTALFMEFSRQEYWSGLPLPSSGDLRDPGIKSRSPSFRQIVYPNEC